jgi:hypothetical protein
VQREQEPKTGEPDGSRYQIPTAQARPFRSPPGTFVQVSTTCHESDLINAIKDAAARFLILNPTS